MIRFVAILVVTATSLACGVSSETPPEAEVQASAPVDGSYLGLTPPAQTATIFAPGVVSTVGRYEYALSIHPRGDRLLFSTEKPDDGAVIYQCRVRDGVLTDPVVVNLSEGSHRSEMEAFFKHVVFESTGKFDLLTYSFPCQDISTAGKGQGLKKGSGTRSGLL